VTNYIDDILHPAARECLRFMKQVTPTEIIHSGDLPARAGLGSSSSFVVGLLNALYAMQGKRAPKSMLGAQAIYIEQQMIKEVVGNQDQLAASYGGFNFISFNKDGFEIRKFDDYTFLKEFNKYLMLFFTGMQRNAFEIEQTKIDDMDKKFAKYDYLNKITEQALKIMTKPTSMDDIGKLLHEEWLTKKELSVKVSTKEVDEIYDAALGAGAIGGKLLGSGGGGFMLFFVEPQKQEAVREKLSKLMHVPFRFSKEGSEIIYSNGSI
jgi:D-glycero-alpha-D-manno-heptose-7-phosphate kinase